MGFTYYIISKFSFALRRENLVMKIYKKVDQKWIVKVQSGAVFLHPTDTTWAISSSAFSNKGYQNLQIITKKYSTEPTTLLVDSIPRLKKYIYQLHPRIETLLSFHHRPITLLFKEIKMLPTHLLDQNGYAAICMVQDKRIKKMINTLNHPLIYKPLKVSPDSYVSTIDKIQSEIKENSDFIYHPSGHLFNQPDVGKPPVMARVETDGGLIFQKMEM